MSNMIIAATSGNWSVPRIVKNLHSLRHQYLDNGGSPDEIINEAEDWGRSLAYLACCFATLALVAIVWDIVVRLIGSCCCTCCCRNNGAPNQYGRINQDGSYVSQSGGWCTSDGWIESPPKPGHRCRWWTTAIFFLVAVAVFAAAVAASGKMKENIHDLSNEARGMQSFRDDVMDSAQALQIIIGNTLVNVQYIKSQSTGEKQIIDECNKAQGVLTSAQSEMQEYMKMVPTDDVNPWVDKVEKYIEPIVVPGHAGLLFFFVLFFMSIVLISRKGDIASKPCSYSCCHILGLLSFFVTWIFVAVYIGMAVGLSDGCMQPNTLAHKAAVEFLSRDSVGLVDYYTSCVGVNPLQEQVDFATTYLNQAHDSVEKLRQYATIRKPSLLPTVNQMDNNVRAANTSVHALFHVIDCHREGGITDYYQQALQSFCGEKGLVVNLAQVFICIAVAELLYIMARWLLPVCNCCRRQHHRHGYVQQQDERAVLLLGQPVAAATPPPRSQNPFGVVVASTQYTGHDQVHAVAIATPVDNSSYQSGSAYGGAQSVQFSKRDSTSSAYGNNGW